MAPSPEPPSVFDGLAARRATTALAALVAGLVAWAVLTVILVMLGMPMRFSGLSPDLSSDREGVQVVYLRSNDVPAPAPERPGPKADVTSLSLVVLAFGFAVSGRQLVRAWSPPALASMPITARDLDGAGWSIHVRRGLRPVDGLPPSQPREPGGTHLSTREPPPRDDAP